MTDDKTDNEESFSVGFDFSKILHVLSEQIYETPLAFIRENVQNAVDAVRIKASRDKSEPGDERYRIDVKVRDRVICCRDNGIGMSADDLRNLFWKIGASGKRTKEAAEAGCIGTFGIGGFANFGVCGTLKVASRVEDATKGHLTQLSEEEIKNANDNNTMPRIKMENSSEVARHGTLVTGHLRQKPNVGELQRYLKDFVRFVPTAVYFNGEKISQQTLSAIEDQENLTKIRDGLQNWSDDGLTISGNLYEDRGHGLVASIEGLVVDQDTVNLAGHLRFEKGPIDVFKRRFKLCATRIDSAIGVNGRLDCDRFVPTAGRDSPDADTMNLLQRIVQVMERIAVEAVLESPDRIAQHTRIFSYIARHGMIDKLSRVNVKLADGEETSLGGIREKAATSGVSVFFGTAQKHALNRVMQARGHIVVILSADKYRKDAERRYLEQYCGAKPFDGMVECTQHYQELNRFERAFLSEIEGNIERSYKIGHVRLIPGELTEDIPIFVKEHGGGQPVDIFVDVRHQEVQKLKNYGFTFFFYSLVGIFCREYLSPVLKKYSLRFFGDGALDLDALIRSHSELWVLRRGDIGAVHGGGQVQTVTTSDIRVVDAGGGSSVPECSSNDPPRIIHITGDESTPNPNGYYLRLPGTAFKAYGDLLFGCDNRGVVWAGNKITYVISNADSASFQYEITVDSVVAAIVNGDSRTSGAIELDKPLRKVYEGIYFPIPQPLERFLVPKDEHEIFLVLYYDWIDMTTAKHWRFRTKESS